MKKGVLTTSQGPALDPDFVLETDGKTFLAVVSGEMPLEEALRQGRMSVAGDEDAFARSMALFDLSPLHERDDEAFPTIDLTGRPATGAHRLR